MVLPVRPFINIQYSKLLFYYSKGNFAEVLNIIYDYKNQMQLLNKKIDDITVKEILTIMNDLDDDKCILGLGLCSEKNKCSMHEVWMESKNSIIHTFSQTTLESLAKNQGNLI